MPAAETQTETGKLEAWRLHVLIEAGYPVEAADWLARDRTVDLHQAVYLLEAGCTWQLALDILS